MWYIIPGFDCLGCRGLILQEGDTGKVQTLRVGRGPPHGQWGESEARPVCLAYITAVKREPETSLLYAGILSLAFVG